MSKSSQNPMIARALQFLDIAKSVDPAALRDVEAIASVHDGHDNGGLPSERELPTSEALAMRGGAAPSDIARNSDLQRQEGLARDYEMLARRLDEMQKGHRALARTLMDLTKSLTKAAECEEERFTAQRDTTDEVEKAFRKARLAVRKADSAEDAEDESEALNRAEEALKAAVEAIGKAEDGAETEEDEKRIEKSYGTLRDLRKSVGAIKAARLAKVEASRKAEADAAKRAEEEAAAEKARADVAAKAESEKKEEDADDVLKSLLALATTKGITPKALIESMSHGAGSLAAPPSFAKAEALTDIPERIAKARLSADEEGLAESLNQRFELAKSGRFPKETFAHALASAPARVREIFTV